MPIKVSCHCGQTFTAKDNLAGQTLLCPKCSQPLTIPSPNAKPAPAAAGRAASPIAELFDEVGLKEYRGARCPQCNAPLRPNAVLCTECGFHLQSGQRVQAARVYKAGERGHAEATESLLDRAAQQLETDKLEQKKNQSQGLPAYVYFIALGLLIGFVVTMFMIPRDQAFTVTGGLIMGFCYLMAIYYSIRILIVAFQESLFCGLMHFVPFYWLYYLVTRWDKVGGYFLMELGYSFASGIGVVLMALAPMMAKDAEDGGGDVWRYVPPTRQVAVMEDAPKYLMRAAAT